MKLSQKLINFDEFFTGENQCDCKVKIVSASSPKNMMKPDKFKICYDFCRFRRVTLKGCSHCSPNSLFEYERHSKASFSGEVEFFPIPHKFAPPPPPPRAPQFVTSTTKMSGPFFPVPQRLFQTTPDATTPNWIKVCAQLCKGGAGGLLCNCDLPPL